MKHPSGENRDKIIKIRKGYYVAGILSTDQGHKIHRQPTLSVIIATGLLLENNGLERVYVF